MNICNTDIEIEEVDISGLLEEKVTVAMLQLKSPFFDECAVKVVGGYQILTWEPGKDEERKDKIMSILQEIKKNRKEVNIILLPEYSIFPRLLDNLKLFSQQNKVILIGTYYDDRSIIEGYVNQNYRKNICFVIFPDIGGVKEIFELPKIDRTAIEADFVTESTNKDKIKLLKFFWNVNGSKLYFQIFVCGDFLSFFNYVDGELGGLIFVPMCSPEIDEFVPAAKFWTRPHKKFLVSRVVFLCNAVTTSKQISDLRIIGGSQILGPYKGRLPTLKDEEGGLFATVICERVITKPATIPSKFNTVIENPVKFSINNQDKKWTIDEIPPRKEEKLKWIINPRIFEYLSLQKYYTFSRLKSYYHYRDVLMNANAKCVGLVGKDDIGIIGLAEEQSDVLMYLYSGRSDVASSLLFEGSQQYFRVKKYMKYKGECNIPEIEVDTQYLDIYRQQIYQLACGDEQKVDINIIEELKSKNIIIGKTKSINPEILIADKKVEFILGIFLVHRAVGKDSCEIFEEEVINKFLLENKSATDILFSDSGGAGGNQASMHYVIHIICEYWTLIDIVINQIHKPLSNMGIEYGTRILPIAEYFSNSEYEAILNPVIGDPTKRREMRELVNSAQNKMKGDTFLLYRLHPIDRNKIIRIFQSCKNIANSISLEESDVQDKTIKFIRGFVNCKNKNELNLTGVNDDIKDLYLALVTCTERILKENLYKKRHEVGEKIFDNELEKLTGKAIILNPPSLGSIIMGTAIWDNSHKDNSIKDEIYTEKVKKIQMLKADNIRNPLSHGENFIKNPLTAKDDIDKVINALIELIDFTSEFSTKSQTEF